MVNDRTSIKINSMYIDASPPFPSVVIHSLIVGHQASHGDSPFKKVCAAACPTMQILGCSQP